MDLQYCQLVRETACQWLFWQMMPKLISKAPGIGAKTAQKIIIELKDKIDIEDMIAGGDN